MDDLGFRLGEHARFAVRLLALFALLGAIGSVMLLCGGCGGGALRANAQAAITTTAAVSVAQAGLVAAKDAALDRVEREHPTDPEHDLAIDAEVARWRPVFLAFDATRSALITWTDAIELAREAQLPDPDIVSLLLPLAAQVVVLYDRAAELAQELGAEVPRLPGIVRGFARSVGGD